MRSARILKQFKNIKLRQSKNIKRFPITNSLAYPRGFTNLLSQYAIAPSYQISRMSTLQGLPYKITHQQASDYFVNHRRFLEANPNKSQNGEITPYKGDPIQALYVPMISVEVLYVSASFVGEYGIDRTEYYDDYEYDATSKEFRWVRKSQTVTDWDSCSGTLSPCDYPFGTCQTQVYAGFNYPRKIMENALQTKEVTQIRPITKEMLNADKVKKIVQPHQMKMGFALEKITARISDLERTRAENFIYRKYAADHVRINTFDVHWSQAEFKEVHSYHMPAYVLETKVGDLNSCKIINAYTGSFGGNKIYSIWKSGMFGASMGGVLTLAFTAFTRPYMLIPQILLRAGLGSAASGIFSGFAAKFYNVRGENQFVDTKINEVKTNEQYIETEDDVARRRMAEEVNDTHEYFQNAQTNIRLPIDKCKLLGLNPEKEITLKMVKSAYYQQMKKWHPDLFRDQQSKKIAEEMSKQLNEANREILDIFQKTPGSKI